MAYFHMSIYTGQQLGSRSFFMSYNLDEGSLGSWKEEPDMGSNQVEGNTYVPIMYMAGLAYALIYLFLFRILAIPQGTPASGPPRWTHSILEYKSTMETGGFPWFYSRKPLRML